MSIGGVNRIRIARAATTAVPPGAPPILPVPYYHQEQDFWCWAACGRMLLGFFRLTDAQQCEFAERAFHGGCCATPGSSTCNNGYFPENSYGNFGIVIARPVQSTTQATLDGELGAGRPIEVTYWWTQGGAHVALVTGRNANGTYEVHDPWYGAGPRKLSEISSGYGLGRWANSYVNLRRR
ncbi:papain-like cysteine protease family protein [Facivitalis istanbulensis]|uniref:papain-like cysteine protease family protein n=1 Tax=Facivitalis istanbulensis TaxID=3075838 RepID=UPI00387AB4EB